MYMKEENRKEMQGSNMSEGVKKWETCMRKSAL